MEYSRRNLIALLGGGITACFVTRAAAQSPIEELAELASHGNSSRLAYIKSPSDQTIDGNSHRGLEALREFSDQRISLAIDEEIIGLDPETDLLEPFRLIYWPIREQDPQISADAQNKVRSFLDNGKLIMFDVERTSPDMVGRVRELLGGYNFGPLTELPENHPLTYPIFRTDDLFGLLNFGPVYIQAPNPAQPEDKTGVIIGQRDWALSWAANQEAALRAGLNTVAYAYGIGNYKEDQFEIQEMIERALE